MMDLTRRIGSTASKLLASDTTTVYVWFGCTVVEATWMQLESPAPRKSTHELACMHQR